MRKDVYSADMAPYFFHQGTNYSAYEYFGSHRCGGGWSFRVWAPAASEVYLVGDFNGWARDIPMSRITEGGVYEVILPNEQVSEGQKYKYVIARRGEDGCVERELYKADPYAFKSEEPPLTASVVYDLSRIRDFAWQDGGWMGHRVRTFSREDKAYPLNIYELHALSWKRNEDGTPLSWVELAEELVPYLKEMGYTHVELMPITEFPFEGSWGYQVTGYYAPTARLGEPEDVCTFIDLLHRAGIGVILDWVPAHFPKDAHGLYEFDGGPLYEFQGVDRMEHRGWGTRRFDVGREEVQCFLVSSADFWLRYYHADGLRVDAVASMLYLDYDKLPGEWIPNEFGDNRCLEAIAFFKKLNGHVKGAFSDVLMIAEESAAAVKVTGDVEDSLGFTYKWNMGWMNDMLSYAEEDPIYRVYHHEKMTFSMTYAFCENYILPVSHDEVVHGKKSFLDRMPGDYWRKFAGARAFYTFMMTHPGKKLNFMGNEIGQFREWDYEGQIEWFLLDYEMHAKYQLFAATLNRFYLANATLWEDDLSWNGFSWIDADNRDQSVFSYYRTDRSGELLLVVLNMTPATYHGYRVGVPAYGKYTEVLNTDNPEFGGSGVLNTMERLAEPVGHNGQEYSIVISLPPLAATIFSVKKMTDPRRKKTTVRRKRATAPRKAKK